MCRASYGDASFPRSVCEDQATMPRREGIELSESPPPATLQKTSGSSFYLAEHVRRRERQLAGSADITHHTTTHHTTTFHTKPVSTETATRPVSSPTCRNQHVFPPGPDHMAETPTLPRSFLRRVSLTSLPVPTTALAALVGASSQVQHGKLTTARGVQKSSGGARYFADVVRRRKVQPDKTKATVSVNSPSLLVSLASASLSPHSKIIALIISSLFGLLILILTIV